MPFVLKKASVYSHENILVPKWLSPPKKWTFYLTFHRRWIYFTRDQWVLETPMEGMKSGFIKKPIVRIKEKSIPKYGNHESVILTEKASYLTKML